MSRDCWQRGFRTGCIHRSKTLLKFFAKEYAKADDVHRPGLREAIIITGLALRISRDARQTPRQVAT